jgi:hypothetical protein
MGNNTKAYIKSEVSKLKKLKAKCGTKMTIVKLKTMGGFENLTDEIAQEVIEQLEEYATVVLKQLNRLKMLKTINKDEQ